MGDRVVRVLPDVSGLAKEFSYLVPSKWASSVEVGSMVRVDLHGRRVGGWVVEVDGEPPAGVELRPVAKVSSLGPPQEVIDLARWAARRWAGHVSRILRSASPQNVVPRPIVVKPAEPGRLGPADSFGLDKVESETVVVRLPPAGDPWPIVAAAASRGEALVISPSLSEARHLGGRFRRSGGRASLFPRDWALSHHGGGVTFGSRSAIWAPAQNLRTIVVFDEHDESLYEERNPTWNARDVAIERARRLGASCFLVSPVPSVAALEAADQVLSPSRVDERAGWPLVELVDRADEDPVRGGLLSPRVSDLVRSELKVVLILNRKGRAKMLACGSCGRLITTEDGKSLMAEVGAELVAATGESRPKLCSACGATTLKRLRLGISRAREELEAMIGEPVEELSGESSADQRSTRVTIGTEAALHRVGSADVVVFLDFDSELMAPRYRAAEQAASLLVKAARIVGGRSGGGRVAIQTRMPTHPVLAATFAADPSRLSEAEAGSRRALGLPPFGALAEIGGAGAEELVAALTNQLLVAVIGPRADGRYLLRSTDPETLATVLETTPRPSKRVRVVVDPPRA